MHTIIKNTNGGGMGQIKRIEESKDSYCISYAINVNTDGKEDETALIKNGKYYILNGNHIEEYAKRNKKEQLEYFKKNKNLTGFWSD